jgi:threonine/homoserine/homoserine lactone efflux protein
MQAVSEFRQGILIGFAVSIPVGPIALLIMRRSISDGKLAGFVSGLGAATADLLCGTASVLGLSAITLMVQSHGSILQLIGGLMMLVLGVQTIRSTPPLNSPRPIHAPNLFLAYGSTCALTLANPMTLAGMAFVAAAAGVGSAPTDLGSTAWIACGIFFGSAAWWLVLSSSAGWLGRKLGNGTLRVINLGAGVLIAAFGVFQLVKAGMGK